MTSPFAIVPYRVDAEGARRRNLRIVLDWLGSAGLPIVLAEHADEPDADLDAPASIVRVHVPAQGRPFNKAAACNAGFAATHGEVIALVDADTLMPMGPFLACAAGVTDDLDVIRPYGRLLELDDPTTASLADGAALPDAPAGDRNDARAGEHIPLCGGLVILRASAYERVGGMDEAFHGWGGEDDALSIALLRSGLRCAVNESAPAFHLAHPRSMESRYGHADYPGNLARARWWHEADEAEIGAAMEAGRARLRRG